MRVPSTSKNVISLVCTVHLLMIGFGMGRKKGFGNKLGHFGILLISLINSYGSHLRLLLPAFSSFRLTKFPIAAGSSDKLLPRKLSTVIFCSWNIRPGKVERPLFARYNSRSGTNDSNSSHSVLGCKTRLSARRNCRGSRVDSWILASPKSLQGH